MQINYLCTENIMNDMIQKLTATLVVLCLFTTLRANVRDTIVINDGWEFRYDGQEEWKKVTLPHDFQVDMPWIAPTADDTGSKKDAAANTASRLSARAFKEMAIGWYRKTIIPHPTWKGKRILLDFQGIMLTGDVWLNDSLIGSTDYGYLGFESDITNLLRHGEPNTIIVKADTGKPENSRWYTGGGLFRDVSLIITHKDKHFARHPLYITTIDNNKVAVQAEIYYSDSEAKAIDVGVRILDSNGIAVAESRKKLNYYRRQKLSEYQIDTLQINNPNLWSPDTPYLYIAEVTLYDNNGNIMDQVTDRFGIRTFSFSPDYGMMLNGNKILLKGHAGHSTLGILGAAAYPQAIRMQLQRLKDFGFNHVRAAHNPYSKDFYRLCDEMGIIVVDELYDKWTKQFCGGRREWSELWQKNIPEWVRSNRNHPSIAMWSLGNELQQIASLDFNDWGVTAYRLQRELLHRYDTTRPTTVAMHPRYRDLATDSLPAPLARVTDIQSYNYRYMYFPLDSRNFPNMIFYQSEANMTGLPANLYAMDLDKVVGLAYWGAIDYLGESRGWPMKGFGEGVFDITLNPKPLAYLIRSMFKTDEPVVRLAIVDTPANDTSWNGIKISTDQTSSHWNRHDGDILKIYTYTNADEVELIINGRSIGRQYNNKENPSTRNKITWEGVSFKSGYIEAVAYNEGHVVARHRSETTGKAVALRITPDGGTWRPNDLQYLRITAIDSKGRVVATNDSDVHLSLEGPVEIIAVGNGNTANSDLARQDHVHLYEGCAQVILKSGSQSGTVIIKASAPGMKTAQGKLSY